MRYFMSVLIVILFTGIVKPCTTAIVSGKCTVDGRPILWKHRDAASVDNKLMYFTDGKYNYIGLVSSEDQKGENVWAGCNSTGFAIMNSASYNLIENDSIKFEDQEGILMKIALQQCSSVDEFEQLLKNLPKPLGVQANFGVIDAKGGAAYFETDQFNYVKIDVNDPKIAPFGFVIRTNYSFTGNPNTGYGYIRYNTANELLNNAVAQNILTPEYIFTEGARCLKNSLTGVDLNTFKPITSFVTFVDFIPRSSSVASVVIQGVKKDESPDLTVMWSVVGFPLTSAAIPVWVAAGEKLPVLVTPDENGIVPICNYANILKNKCYPIKRGNGENYIKIDELINTSNTGILQKNRLLEKIIVNATNEVIDIMRNSGFDKQSVIKHYEWLDKIIRSSYKENYDL
ncbi:MAG: hypothetical protein V1773_17415 [bacterium]